MVTQAWEGPGKSARKAFRFMIGNPARSKFADEKMIGMVGRPLGGAKREWNIDLMGHKYTGRLLGKTAEAVVGNYCFDAQPPDDGLQLPVLLFHCPQQFARLNAYVPVHTAGWVTNIVSREFNQLQAGKFSLQIGSGSPGSGQHRFGALSLQFPDDRYTSGSVAQPPIERSD